VGAGGHREIQAQPYVFGRTLDTGSVHDRVVVALDEGTGAKTVPVGGVFPDGTVLVDSYSGARGSVRNGAVTLTTAYPLVLLAVRPGP
jgi:alpha-amylase